MSQKPGNTPTLKELAALVGLNQSTVSRVVNGEADKYRISQQTQQRVMKAAIAHGYTANTVARSLRLKRTHTVGVIVPEISEGYSTTVLGGIEDELLKDGYFYFVVSHRHRPDLLEVHSRMMLSRGVEGIIAIDTALGMELPVPIVSVSGHAYREGVINIELDHQTAAELALAHLQTLGHKHIAFIKGQAFSSDTERRWLAIEAAAKSLNIAINPQLVVQLQGAEPGPGPGIESTRLLLESKCPFTAIFAFNDVTAMGAMLVLREAGLRVPKDISVIGFDDVPSAAISNPPLTTIHQPLRDMGQVAASTLLKLIDTPDSASHPPTLTVHPKLIVRKSTAHVLKQ